MFNLIDRMQRRTCAALFVLCFCGFVVQPATAVYEKGDGSFPWDLPYYGHHDKPIMDKLGKGFFLNVGPTGIRAQITHKHPEYFTVRFVFDNSPAAGKIKAGDVIIGANGKVMKLAHTFGRRHNNGMKGPMTLMAQLIEESQGRDGKLDLIVWPGGDRAKQKTVMVQLKPVGKFSPTFPYNCPRTDALINKLCDFLVREYEREGGFKGRVHSHSACVLALMASGDDRYAPLIRKILAGYANKRYDPNNGGGFPTWGWGYDGIVMGEYYLLTKDQSLKPAIASLTSAYELGQTWTNGGYSHKPFPFIQKRIAGGGPKGYGAMSQPGGMAMIAMSLFDEAGLPYSQEAYERLHQAYLASGASGEVGYGFPTWDHAVIELNDDNSPCKSPKGIGYRCMTGLKNIGDFKVIWPNEKETRSWVNKDLSWMKREASEARVYQMGGKQRLVIRDMTRPEPRGPFPPPTKPIGHYGRSGQGALAHLIGNPPKTWQWLGKRNANACASSPGDLLRGHASTLMGTLWGSLGASRADERLFRSYMDEIKWWFIMAEAHNGGFVVMPGHDYAATDNIYGGRILPTATASLILSVSRKKIRITGAESGTSPGRAPTPNKTSPRDNNTLSIGSPTKPAAEPTAKSTAPASEPISDAERDKLLKQVEEARANLEEVKASVLAQTTDREYRAARAKYDELRAKASKPGADSIYRLSALNAGTKLKKHADRVLARDPRVAEAKAKVMEAIRALNARR